MSSSFYASIKLAVKVFPASCNIISEGILVAATWHSKDLRSPCNLLIAIDALLNVFTGVEIILGTLLLPLFFHGEGGIGVFTCFKMIFSALFLIETVSLMPVMIAVERLLNVFFPIWAQYRNPWKYATLMSTPVFIYGIGVTAFNGMQFYAIKDTIIMECDEGILFFGEWAIIVLQIKCTAIVAFCWLSYAAIWFRVKRWKTSRSHSSTNASADPDNIFQRVSRTLAVFLTLITVSWSALPLSTSILLNLFQLAPEAVANIGPIIGNVSVPLSSALMTPAFYLFSSEYHKAIGSLFSRIFRKKNAIQPQQQQPEQVQANQVLFKKTSANNKNINNNDKI